jgi:cobalt/nickel transport system permease protein
VSQLNQKKSRWLLAAALAVIFVISAITDIAALLAIGVVALLIFWRSAWQVGRKVLLMVVPPTGALLILSWGWLYLTQNTEVPIAPFFALFFRTALIAFVSFSVLQRVNLLRALEGWPTALRLLVVTLAQIHALRLLATESLMGLRSRLLRKPSPTDVVRGAGGLTAALFTLTLRNAREISEAMRSRGF